MHKGTGTGTDTDTDTDTDTNTDPMEGNTAVTDRLHHEITRHGRHVPAANRRTPLPQPLQLVHLEY
jgi:hypothetical protein